MILISLILLTVFYYLLLWYLQRKRQVAFQRAALEVIGPTKGIEPLSINKDDVFGATDVATAIDTESLESKRNISSKATEQTSHATVFDTATVSNDSIVANPLEVIVKDLPQAVTDTETQQEAISDLNTKEELNLIAKELGYYETTNTASLTEENDLEQMMEVFGDFSELYQQEVQEVIGNNTKSPL